MNAFSVCRRCLGFTPNEGECPHCRLGDPHENAVTQLLRRALLVLGGSAVSVTLAACYGAPCASTAGGAGCHDHEVTCADPELDLDQDGSCGDYDCDEEDASVYINAYDSPDDGVDQDCDGQDETSAE